MSGVLIRVLLVLLPVLLYLLWLRYRQRRQTALDGEDEAALAAAQRELSWGVGFVVVLLVSGFAYLAFTGGEDPNSRYVPPRVEDGEVVPGHFERANGRELPDQRR